MKLSDAALAVSYLLMNSAPVQGLKGMFSRARGEMDDFWFNKVWAKVWAGTRVNEESALTMSAVYACIKILSDTIGYLPLNLYRRDGNDGREKVPSTKLTDVFKYAPNPEMSAFRFKQLFMGHLAAWGNAYMFVNRDKANRVIDLWPLRPDRMEVKRDPGTTRLQYIYRGNSGQQIILTPRECWHIPGFGFDGVSGYSVIKLAAQGIGLGLAAEEFSARFFGQGTHMGAVVKLQRKLSPEAHKKLENSMAKGYSGLGKTHQLMVLEEGMDIEKLGIHPEDASLIAQRQFQIQDVCRFYRIPMHLVQEESRSTFNNIAEQGINFARHTITPWAALIEGEMNLFFLTPSQRKTLYWEFDLNGLMRGDFKARMEGYVQAVSNGIFTRNEVRKLENMNAMPGKGGDILTVQLAMTNLEDVADPPEPTRPVALLPAPGGEEDLDELENKSWAMRLLLEDNRATKVRAAVARDRIAETFKPLIKRAAKEIVNREANAVTKAASRNIREKQTRDIFNDWLDEFYGLLPTFIRKKLGPVFDSFAESIQAEAAAEIGQDPDMTPELKQWVANYTERYIERHVDSSVGQIRQLADEAMESVEDRMIEWQEKRAGKIAENESVRMAQGLASVVWFAAGLGAVWAIRGPSTCPYCRELKGRKIQQGEAFIQDGTEWEPKGATNGPMKIRGTKTHPPLHQGCDCLILPG